MKKVLVFGTFDGIHEGHLDFFKQAKKYGDYLIAVVGRDETIKKIKHRCPEYSEKERLRAVQNMTLVNEARMGYKGNPYRIILKIKPEVICLGYDQNSFTKNLRNEIKKLRLKTKVRRLKAYKPEKYHSSIVHPVK